MIAAFRTSPKCRTALVKRALSLVPTAAAVRVRATPRFYPGFNGTLLNLMRSGRHEEAPMRLHLLQADMGLSSETRYSDLVLGFCWKPVPSGLDPVQQSALLPHSQACNAFLGREGLGARREFGNFRRPAFHPEQVSSVGVQCGVPAAEPYRCPRGLSQRVETQSKFA